MIHCDIALAWAVEPEEFSVPVAQAMEEEADALDEPEGEEPLADGVEPVLLSDPQALSESAPTRARPARRACRVSVTAVPFSGFTKT